LNKNLFNKKPSDFKQKLLPLKGKQQPFET
jgi:hypothetical protein